MMNFDLHLLPVLSVGYKILLLIGTLILVYLTIGLTVIVSKYLKAVDYNNFVLQCYGRLGKKTPTMILRIQNSYIKDYNRVHDGFVGKLFRFKRMAIFEA